MAKPKKGAAPAPGMTTRLGELAEAGDEARALRAERTRESIGEWVPVADLLPWVKNPRKNDAAVEKVAASIKRWGFVAPIIARRANGEVVAGHTRLKAAKALGLEMVPVRYVDLDPAEAHLYAVADNKLNELAEWDGPQLLEILSEFGLPDLEVAGFDQAELDKLAAGLVGPEVPDPADAPDDEPHNQQYGVIVMCSSETHQERVYDELKAAGHNCKVVVT